MGADNSTPGAGGGFGSFAAKQMLPVVLVAVAVIAALWIGIQYFGTSDKPQNVQHESIVVQHAEGHEDSQDTTHAAEDTHVTENGHADGASVHTPQAAAAQEGSHETVATDTHTVGNVHKTEESHTADQTAVDEKVHASANSAGTAHESPSSAATGHGDKQAKSYPMAGMAFVDAVIQPMDYELNHRLYGWRPNDIVEYTDNVNNFQRGVLEVTRRTSRILAERLSRTGSSSSFDPNLETAMNWFMIKADRYWFPSAESKYREGLNELREYYYNLEKGEAHFYTRTDNLIPLLSAYQDLLGSCDENLVKTHEADGSPVSLFEADNYFYYSKGVASALHTILSAIEIDFNIMVSREGGLEVLHHAIEMCHQATEIEPWIVLNSGDSSIFANHRANMAAPISHARYYIGVLIKALST